MKLNEHVHQLLQHQDGERNRSLLLKQDAIEMFEEMRHFKHYGTILTKHSKLEDSLHNVSNAFSKTGKSVLHRSMSYKLPSIHCQKKEIDSDENLFLIFF